VGAIGRNLFLCAALTAGCSPDLERSAGDLVILVLGVPESADAIQGVVRSAGREHRSASPPERGRLAPLTVPDGEAVATVQALEAGRVLVEKTEIARVVANTTTTIAIDLEDQMADGGVSDGGPQPAPSTRSRIAAVARNVRSDLVSDGQLRIRTDIPQDDLRTFAAAARIELEGEPDRIEVERITVELRSIRDATSFARLFSGPVRASIASRDRPLSAEVALGELPSGATTGRLEGLPSSAQDDFQALRPDVLDARVDLMAVGPAAQPAGSDFEAELTFLITFVASRSL
jgi:hypothetical protein